MVKWRSSLAFALEAFEHIKSEENRLREQWLHASDPESRTRLQARLAEIKAQALETNARILALLRACPSMAPGLFRPQSQACH